MLKNNSRIITQGTKVAYLFTKPGVRALTLLLLAFAIASAVTFFTTNAKVAMAPGDLDTTFSGDGFNIVDSQNSRDTAYAIAAQADGKVVAVGAVIDTGNRSSFGVARYNTDGSTDMTFGSAGRVVTRIGTDTVTGSTARGVAIQTDGKIVVVGYSRVGPTDDYVVARYNTDGSLDPGFGTGGIVITNLLGGTGADQANAVVIQPDGKIVAAGRTVATGTSSDFSIARYNTDGTLDTSFDMDGFVVTAISTSTDIGTSLALQPDGKLVLAGRSNHGAHNDFTFVRYNTDGSLDTTFSGDGIARDDFASPNEELLAMAIGSDGKIVGGGNDEFGDGSIVRYNADGTLDTTFGTGGRVQDFSIRPVNALAVMGDGRILAAGRNLTDFITIRFAVNGNRDTTFNGNSQNVTDFNTRDDIAHALLMLPDGKVVVAGKAFDTAGTHEDFAIARYNASGTTDTTFDTDGEKTTDMANSSATLRDTVVQPDGKIVAVGSASNGTRTEFVAMRFNPDGMLDTTFDGDGIVRTRIGTSTSDVARAVALQPDGKIVVAGSSSSLAAIVRYNTNGSLDTTFDADGSLTIGGGIGDTSTRVINGLALQPDGKIIICGSTNLAGFSTTDFYVERRNADGSDDAGWAFTAVQFGVTTEIPNDIAVQSDGKVVVVGGASPNAAVARYNANGTLDTTFSDDGLQTFSYGLPTSSAAGVSIQTDGKIVLAGIANSTSVFNVGVARLNVDGTLDTAFAGDGTTMTDFAGSTDYGVDLNVLADGRIAVGGVASQGNDINFAVFRYNADGSPDVTLGVNGIAVADLGNRDEAAEGFAVDQTGRYILVGRSRGTFAIARLLGDNTTASGVSISGRVLTSEGRGVRSARVTMTSQDGSVKSVFTGPYGKFQFDDVEAGQTYVVSVQSRRFSFAPQVVQVNDNVTDLDFVAGSSSFNDRNPER